MLFQYVLKGIVRMNAADADFVLQRGLLCNWWRRVHDLPQHEVSDRLSDGELLHHLQDYTKLVPGESYTYGENSPFISTSAGTFQAATSRSYKHFSAEWTAVRFATDTFREKGVVFRCWLPLLGRPSLPLQAFAEEVRDPNQYSVAYGYHHQGEIVGKIHIPPSQIEGYAEYEGAGVAAAWRTRHAPRPRRVVSNANFIRPEDYANVRDVV